MARLALAVGGSVAAFKACELVSRLVQDGHTVDVLMTAAARRFVQPLSFAALTGRAVVTDETFWSETVRDGGPADHLTVTATADLFVVAPCTADLIAKFAAGLADEIVSTTYLGVTSPVLLAPAMNLRMWAHPRVQANLTRLQEDGVHTVGPSTGWLAEGDVGPGRMAEPEEIRRAIEGLSAQATGKPHRSS